jgi:hypothetical protein
MPSGKVILEFQAFMFHVSCPVSVISKCPVEVAVFKHLVGSCLDCSGTVVVFFGISVYLFF